MSADSTEEVVLPFTPTNTARRSKIGYFGISGENFNDLWPLFVGVVASVIVGIAFATGELGSAATLACRLVMSVSPTVIAYGYLRMFVHERPPHFRGDLWSDFGSLQISFVNPPAPRVPCWPLVERGGSPPKHRTEAGHPLAGAGNEG